MINIIALVRPGFYELVDDLEACCRAVVAAAFETEKLSFSVGEFIPIDAPPSEGNNFNRLVGQLDLMVIVVTTYSTTESRPTDRAAIRNGLAILFEDAARHIRFDVDLALVENTFRDEYLPPRTTSPSGVMARSVERIRQLRRTAAKSAH